MPMALSALLALLLMLAPLAARAQAAAGAVSEYAVKSALLFKLPRFVYLPRFEGGTSVTLCVLGQNPFGGALEK
ncbi:MAG: YfiR family protein, partial [Comamonadaceae bacterium]|nr:YfiR family protein [Comamonadaceae bacterium]